MNPVGSGVIVGTFVQMPIPTINSGFFWWFSCTLILTNQKWQKFEDQNTPTIQVQGLPSEGPRILGVMWLFTFYNGKSALPFGEYVWKFFHKQIFPWFAVGGYTTPLYIDYTKPWNQDPYEPTSILMECRTGFWTLISSICLFWPVNMSSNCFVFRFLTALQCGWRT